MKGRKEVDSSALYSISHSTAFSLTFRFSISTTDVWELSTLADKLSNILEHLRKQLAACYEYKGPKGPNLRQGLYPATYRWLFQEKKGTIPTVAALATPQVIPTEGQESFAELDNLQNSNSHIPPDHTTKLDKLPNSHNPTDHTAIQPTKPSHLKKPNSQDTITRHPTPDDQHTQIPLKDKQLGPTATKSNPQPREDSHNVTTEGTMHAELHATTVTKGKGHAQDTLVGKKATKSHENTQGFQERTNIKMDSLQSQSQGAICSASTSYTADPNSSMDADQGHKLSQQDRTNKEPPPVKKKKGGRKQREAVQEWARKDNLDILGIIEPRLGSNKFSEISARMGLQGWLSADNGIDPNKCRILVTWNPAKLMVQILDHAPQWMLCETTLIATNKKLLITFVHGLNTPAERNQLWEHLVGRSSVNTLVPWLAIGDFNAILSGEDRAGGSQRWPQHMEDFPVCIQQAGLSSLPYTGMRFTWSNGQTGANGIQKKLDWALANSALLQAWPAAHANFLPRLVSDHSPMTINLAQEKKARNKPFRFLNLWTDRDGFLDMVNGVWNQPVHACYKLLPSSFGKWEFQSIRGRGGGYFGYVPQSNH
ncbi:hypothetical protein OIU77_016242 [Salix suchowensis]|uniref:Endonuclease/exonuclease/phosphatase domain-containing protein n=1 Tax=Salix suchowensis TaxID=1278906 RepID=A0ABQ8ZJX5_9ROSI|nr:hypothetical protein OIU77_016242 [Salix suchowensis]